MRTLAIVLALLAAALAGGAFWLDAKLGYVPPWYAAGGAQAPRGSAASGDAIVRRIERELATTGRTRIVEAEVPDLLAHVAETRLGVPLGDLVHGLRTRASDGGADIELVIDGALLAEDGGVPGAGAALAQALAYLPGGLLDEVYVGARLDPGEGSVIQRTGIRLGAMELPLMGLLADLDPGATPGLGRALAWIESHRIEPGDGSVLIAR